MSENPRKIFSDIYDKYIEKIYRFVFFKVNSEDMAKDLTSDIFTRTWRAINSGKKLDNPSAFLYQVARNLVIDYYRQRGEKLVSLADCKEIPDGTDINEKACDSSDLELIKSALSGVSDDYREVITLRYIEDFSIPEIAKTLARPEGTVRVMLSRGLDELRDKMKIGDQEGNTAKPIIAISETETSGQDSVTK